MIQKNLEDILMFENLTILQKKFVKSVNPHKVSMADYSIELLIYIDQ